MIHQLKTEKEYFKEIEECKKTFEVRNNDRNFQVGDYLGLNEIDEEGKETGTFMIMYVSYVMNNPEYCKSGFAILGIKPCEMRVSQIRDEMTGGMKKARVFDRLDLFDKNNKYY